MSIEDLALFEVKRSANLVHGLQQTKVVDLFRATLNNRCDHQERQICFIPLVQVESGETDTLAVGACFRTSVAT